MKRINMLSSADKIKGQGVGSAYLEQVDLVRNGLVDYDVVVNHSNKSGILHHHTIDLKHYITSQLNPRSIHLGYVHFLPKTLEGSIKLPKVFSLIFNRYVIKFYKKMDHLVTVNPYFISILEDYGIDRSKVTYIPNYVSENAFFEMDDRAKRLARKAYGIDESQFVVLGVGQVQTRKGVLDFIEVAKKNPDKIFIWAGGFSFGIITDGYKELKEIVDNPLKNVMFLGIIDRENMNTLFNISSVLFMPSYNELFPMSILEAMSTNTPILLRNLDIYKEILNGYYLKADDNQAFDCIIKKLDMNKNYYKEASIASQKGNTFYCREHVLSLWQKLYDTLSDDLGI